MSAKYVRKNMTIRRA